MNVFRFAVSASSFAHARIMPTESKAERFQGDKAKENIGKVIACIDEVDVLKQALQTKTNYLSSRAEQHYLNKKNE